jgi:hypothetical protein
MMVNAARPQREGLMSATVSGGSGEALRQVAIGCKYESPGNPSGRGPR